MNINDLKRNRIKTTNTKPKAKIKIDEISPGIATFKCPICSGTMAINSIDVKYESEMICEMCQSSLTLDKEGEKEINYGRNNKFFKRKNRIDIKPKIQFFNRGGYNKSVQITV